MKRRKRSKGDRKEKRVRGIEWQRVAERGWEQEEEEEEEEEEEAKEEAEDDEEEEKEQNGAGELIRMIMLSSKGDGP